MYLGIQLGDVCTGDQDWHTGNEAMLWEIQMIFQMLVLFSTDSLS